jgi:uncharacterized protein YdhG (YjbR/CyaY superfamily)
MNKEVDKYIAGFPKEVQEILEKLRKLIKKLVPEATETINYQIPTFVFGKRNLVHFAAFKKHIGFYPTPSGIETLKKDLAPYKFSKGCVQFPLDKALPLELIKRMVEFRVKEELKRK